MSLTFIKLKQLLFIQIQILTPSMHQKWMETNFIERNQWEIIQDLLTKSPIELKDSSIVSSQQLDRFLSMIADHV